MKTLFGMAVENVGRAPLRLGFLIVCFVQPAFSVERYFPLDPGNRWDYVTEDGIFSGQLEVSVLEREGNRVRVNLGHGEVVLEDRGDEIDIELGAEGLVPYYRFDEERWNHRDPFSCDDDRLLEITDREAVVETPAGNFTDCLQIEYKGHTLCNDAGTFVEWWAPGVGRVKWQEDNIAGPVTWVLQSYTQVAADFAPRAYELREGSVIIDACGDCERPTVVESLRGTLTLTRLPVRRLGEAFSVSEIHFESSSYIVRGEGDLWRTTGDPDDQGVDLDLEVEGIGGIHLAGTATARWDLWPTFDIEASEEGERDPLHVYRVRIVAAPVTEMVLYELVEGQDGSYFFDDCLLCGRPVIPIPIGGTFLLGRIEDGPGTATKYRIDALNFHSLLEFQEYGIEGLGFYSQADEVPPLQGMDLTIQVNGARTAGLESGSIAAAAEFPAVEIHLSEVEPPDILSVYSLQIVARPAESLRFRRGDGNADDNMDLSDAVFILNYLFAGGLEPDCRDSADSDDNGALEITDAVYLLNYLFRGGPEPEEPFPSCRPDATPDELTCESFSPCAQ